MVFRSFSVADLMLLAVVVGSVFLWTSGSDGLVYGNYSLKHDNISLRREKRRTTQPQNGFFFPIAMYTVRHHRPPNDRSRAVRPETWEYRGQYFYGFRPKPNSGRRRAARLLAAGLPLLLAPLLSILFSFPVVIPVAQMTAVTTGASFPGHYGLPHFGRRKRRRRSEPPQFSPERAARLKELEVVTDYLHQVNYDEKQQSRVMVNYLQCNGLLSPEDHCLERLSCEFGDPANEKAPELERTVTSILLGHMLGNEFIPKPFKKRLKAAATHGRHNSGKCSKFFCNYVDNNWDFTSNYPQSPERPEDIAHGEQEIHSSPQG